MLFTKKYFFIDDNIKYHNILHLITQFYYHVIAINFNFIRKDNMEEIYIFYKTEEIYKKNDPKALDTKVMVISN